MRRQIARHLGGRSRHEVHVVDVNMIGAVPSLSFRGGRLLVVAWPARLACPFGLSADGTRLTGPARLRGRVLSSMRQAGLDHRDEVAHQMDSRVPKAPVPTPPVADEAVGSALTALRYADDAGLVVGLSGAARVGLVATLVHSRRQRAMVVVVDSAAADRWQDDLARAGFADWCEVRGIAQASRDVGWQGADHDLLVVDMPELMPRPALEGLLDGSAATVRIGLAGRLEPRSFTRWEAGLGALVGIVDEARTPRCHELRVPLPQEAAAAHAAAWHEFLLAFDRFAALRPAAGFGAFVEQARRDPLQRPALHAWHEALRLAAWHEHKAALIAELLHRHRHQRVLLFTPDRRSTYALAREHLIAAVTAEIPRAERRHALASFAKGSLRVLAGPRLLDLGVPDGCADVAILVGGGFGRDQRSVRCRRVAPEGIVYELVSLDTVEVGRAHRWRGTTADATVVVHQR